ncbi:MAG: hypothetical protein MET45_11615 [Nostoc sp. LLA-1]|nr:hypothetical protein [Cyanocohniella sp. LLY]
MKIKQMAEIIVSDLHFPVSESFLIEITDMHFLSVYGGDDYAFHYAFHQMIHFAYRLLDFMLTAFSIYSIVSLAHSFGAANIYSPPSPFIPF